MNFHTPELNRLPNREDAAEALDQLRAWARHASAQEIADIDPALARLLPGAGPSSYPVLARSYPHDFEVDAAYKSGLPDLQNGPSSLIRGAKAQIQHVGISNFRLPIRFHTRDGADMGQYSHLLTEAIRSMIDVTAERDVDSLFSPGHTTALVQTIAGLDDFELIAFLAIVEEPLDD